MISVFRAISRARTRPHSYSHFADGFGVPRRSCRRLVSMPAKHVQQPEPVPVSWPAKTSNDVDRREAIRASKPFSEFLTDTFNRQHDYLRISVTERCNLRCLYCMPEEGITLSPAKHLLTSSEIFYLSSLFVSQGVTKIRLTGGEPTVRKDILPLMHSIGSLRSKGLRELAITTNGISLHRKLDSMVEAGLTAINLSLDTLDPFQFQIMTRRNGFDAVKRSIDRIMDMKRLGAPLKLKINCVVMRGLNEREIVPFVELGREQDIEARFIEYMPFGGNKWSKEKMVPFNEMLDKIREKYPGIHRVQGHKNDTSKTYQIPGFVGKVGFITSMTNDFCGTCNRLRITSDGNLKVCLHGNTEVSLRDVLREHNGGETIDETAFQSIRQTEIDRANGKLRNDTPFGWGPRETHLLQIIGAAVKRKKEKHADMGDLENMENRPMILIGSTTQHVTNPSAIWNSDRTFKYPMASPRFVGTSRSPSLPFLPYSSSLPPSMRAYYSKSSKPPKSPNQEQSKLPHLTSSGEAHMVRITTKEITHRRAIAVGRVSFSDPQTSQLIRSALIKKGDVLGTARVAGIMAAKNCPALVPLCHPIILSSVRVDVQLAFEEAEGCGGVDIEAEVECVGQTGVEMEALTAVSGACLTVIDMVKGVDRGAKIEEVKVVLKEGGRSGVWRDESWSEMGHN